MRSGTHDIHERSYIIVRVSMRSNAMIIPSLQ